MTEGRREREIRDVLFLPWRSVARAYRRVSPCLAPPPGCGPFCATPLSIETCETLVEIAILACFLDCQPIWSSLDKQTLLAFHVWAQATANLYS